mgnify:CR=1 FL=1
MSYCTALSCENVCTNVERYQDDARQNKPEFLYQYSSTRKSVYTINDTMLLNSLTTACQNPRHFNTQQTWLNTCITWIQMGTSFSVMWIGMRIWHWYNTFQILIMHKILNFKVYFFVKSITFWEQSSPLSLYMLDSPQDYYSQSKAELVRYSPRSVPNTSSFTIPHCLSWVLAGLCRKNCRKNAITLSLFRNTVNIYIINDLFCCHLNTMYSDSAILYL